MQLSIEHLQKMSTKNLLALFRAERARLGRLSQRCDCCGESVWDIYPNLDSSKQAKLFYDEKEKYVKILKSLLSKREHVARKT